MTTDYLGSDARAHITRHVTHVTQAAGWAHSVMTVINWNDMRLMMGRRLRHWSSILIMLVKAPKISAMLHQIIIAFAGDTCCARTTHRLLPVLSIACPFWRSTDI